MRLLILGGTVFLSRTVAELAVRRGHHVTCACRGRSGPVPEGARHVVVDRDDPEGLAPLTRERFDAVIDVARKPTQVERAMRALADRAGHWCFVSTVSVYADQATPGQRVDTAPLLEAAPPGTDESDPERYGELKVRCEQVVRQHRGGDAFIVRAGLIGGPYDPTDRFTYWPLRLARGGDVLAPGSPDDAVQVIDVRDLAEWMLDGAEHGLTGTYDGVGPVMRRAELLERVAAGVGAEATLTWVDQDFLADAGVAPWMGERSLPLWLPLPEYAGLMTRDPEPAFTAGLRCRDIADTARDTREWALAAGRAHPGKAGLTPSDEAELLRAWHHRTVSDHTMSERTMSERTASDRS